MNIPNAKDMNIWSYKGLKVYYYEELDGDGTNQAPAFVNFIQKNFKNKKFNRVFEWCAGPAFIGFALLKEGLCNELCIADINPKAIECVLKTIKENDLPLDKITFYISDNFNSIPMTEKFDLVVGNPPNYYKLNPNHQYYEWLKNDLRPNDPEWKIHKSFYSNVTKYLNKGAFLLIEEVEPYEKLVYTPINDPEPFDIRDNSPIESFVPMIEENGLKYLYTEHFLTDKQDGVKLYLMVSQFES